MTTVKIPSIKTDVRKHWEIQGLQSRWRWFVDVDYFIVDKYGTGDTQIVDTRSPMSVEIGPKACISVARGQTWQGHTSCLKKTQLVGSLVAPTSLHQCSGSPAVE